MSAPAVLAPAQRPPLTVAIASKVSLRPAWQQLRGAIRARGLPIRIVSAWIDELPPTVQQENWNAGWYRAIAEAAAADLLLARVTADDDARVILAEIGAAIGAGRQVAILGSHPLLERLRAHDLVEYGWEPDQALQAVESHLQDRERQP